MAGAGVAALVPLLTQGATAGMQALSNQGRSPVAAIAPRGDTSTAAIAAAGDSKTRKAAARNAREERLYALLTDPQVMGVLVTLGGLMVSCRLPFHENPSVNAKVQGAAAASCVLMGLGRAGVGDLTTLMMATATGLTVGAGGGGGLGGSMNIPGTDMSIRWYELLGGPSGLSLFGLRQLIERANE